MKILTMLIFLWPILLIAQKPYELERFPAEYYLEQIKEVKSPYNPEAAVQVWWLAYKAQRASNPGQYFPQSNTVRNDAKSIIQTSSAKSEMLYAIDFIESAGALAACERLVNSNSKAAYILPYRFMAAFLLGNEGIERSTLLEMDSQGLLSPVMKAFGVNAMKSANANDLCVTSGMQDLIAIRTAQLINGLNYNVVVYNIFASKCTAYKGKSVESILSGKESIWISPVCPEELLRRHSDRLQMVGLGFAISSDENLESAHIRFAISVSKMDWSKKSNTSLTPADKGLLQAMKPLAVVMEQQGFKKEATTLNNYLKYYANR